MADRLAALMTHFPMSAQVFNTAAVRHQRSSGCSKW